MAKKRPSQPLPERPHRTLGNPPVIESPQQVSLAFRWLQWLRAQLAAARSAYNAGLQQLEAEYARATTKPIGGKYEQLETYAEQLEAALIDHARDQDLCPESQRTWQEPQQLGAISARQSPEKVMLLQEEDEAALVERLLQELEILPQFERLFARNPRFRQFLRIEIKLNKTGILQQHKERLLSDEQLAAVGLKVDRDPDKFTVKLGSG